jgi:hypothetical protein
MLERQDTERDEEEERFSAVTTVVRRFDFVPGLRRNVQLLKSSKCWEQLSIVIHPHFIVAWNIFLST